MRRPLALAMTIMACLAGHAEADLINGGFELPFLGGTTLETFQAGDTGLTGWKVEAGNVDVVNSGFLGMPSADGHQWLDTSGDTPGTISQVMAASAGTTYRLTFSFSGYKDPDGRDSSGDTLLYQIFTPGGGKPDVTLAQGAALVTTADLLVYNQISIQATATTSLLGVRFQSVQGVNNTDNYLGPVIDAVGLTATAVPEPSSLGLVAVAGLVSLRYRRLRKNRRRP